MQLKRTLPLLAILLIIAGCTRTNNAGGTFDTVDSQGGEINIATEPPQQDVTPTETIPVIDPNATDVPDDVNAQADDSATATPRVISPTEDEAPTDLSVPTATDVVASATPIPPTATPQVPTATEAVIVTPVPPGFTPEPTLTPTDASDQPTLQPTPTGVGDEEVVTGECEYAVQDGDNLFRISLNNDVSLAALLSANGLTEASVIQPGQVLTIPGCNDDGTASVAEETVDEEPTERVLDSCEIEIETGDTLFGLSLEYDVTLQALLIENGLPEDAVIQPGQIITLPDCVDADSAAAQSFETEAEVTEEAAGERIHTVVAGETLQIIAAQYDGISVNDIVGANTIPNVNQLTVGQQLVIPTPEPEVETDDE